MKIIIEKVIDDKLAQLILCDDNITVNVIYDGDCINTSTGGTWDNLNGSGLEEGYLDIIVETFLESKNIDEEFESKVKELGW